MLLSQLFWVLVFVCLSISYFASHQYFLRSCKVCKRTVVSRLHSSVFQGNDWNQDFAKCRREGQGLSLTSCFQQVNNQPHKIVLDMEDICSLGRRKDCKTVSGIAPEVRERLGAKYRSSHSKTSRSCGPWSQAQFAASDLGVEWCSTDMSHLAAKLWKLRTNL